MSDLRQFVAEVLERRGAVVEVLGPDQLEVLAPAALQQQLGWPELARLGFDTGRSETPITPVILGDSESTIQFSNRLFEEGVFGTSVVYPTVAADRARIRTIVTAAHTDDLLHQALATFDRVGHQLGVISG